MIVREVMTTKVVTVTPDDTLSHAANILRQYQFHHLPVVKDAPGLFASETTAQRRPVLEGLLTSQDVNMAATMSTMSSSELLQRPWQERRVAEVMHRASIRVTPTTSVAGAAQILVERGLNCLPVVEYEPLEQGKESESNASQAVLVGLITRSDLLMVLARALGAFEPGMQLHITLPMGDLSPLAKTLLLAAELHIQVRSVIAAPGESGAPLSATVRLGTIYPAPLLKRLQEEKIAYSFADVE